MQKKNTNTKVKGFLEKWKIKGSEDSSSQMKTLAFGAGGFLVAALLHKPALWAGIGTAAAGLLLKNKYLPVAGLTMAAAGIMHQPEQGTVDGLGFKGQVEKVKNRFVGLKDKFMYNSYLHKLTEKTPADAQTMEGTGNYLDTSELDAIEAELTAQTVTENDVSDFADMSDF